MIIKTTAPLKLVLSLILIGGLSSSCQKESSKYYDEDAIGVLDQLTKTIGELNSCSFTVSTTESSPEKNNGTETFKQTDAYINGHSQMYFYTVNEGERKAVWYNNTSLSVFDYEANAYETIEVPRKLLRVIDSVHTNFIMEFPAADFFYPTLTDDIIAMSDTVSLLENRMFGEIECHEIYAKNNHLEMFILVDSKTHLPVQLEIYGLGDKNSQTYVATFTNWVSNPKLPNTLFEFSPPEGSTESDLIKKKL